MTLDIAPCICMCPDLLNCAYILTLTRIVGQGRRSRECEGQGLITYMIQSVANRSSTPRSEASRPSSVMIVLMTAPPGIPGTPIEENHANNLSSY